MNLHPQKKSRNLRSRRGPHIQKDSSSVSAGKSSLADNGDTRELAYYPLQAVARLFLRGTILPEDPQPSSPLSFYGHQSARYVDQSRFATLLVKRLPTEPNPRVWLRKATHALIVHATSALPSVWQTMDNPSRSSSSSSSSSNEIG